MAVIHKEYALSYLIRDINIRLKNGHIFYTVDTKSLLSPGDTNIYIWTAEVLIG
jgi:hypothetical protein